MPASKEIQANIIAALKESFSPDHLAKPQNMPWRSALFGPSTSTSTSNASSSSSSSPAAKPIRIDLMLMLQQSILKASGVEGGIAKRAEAVPLIVETVRSNPTEIPFLTITDSPNGEAGKELIVYSSSSSSSENKEADTTAAAAPVRPANSAAANSSATAEENNNNNNNINIDERTIFASPIHFKATDSEIASFFAQYGTVTSVERRRYLVRGVAKLRPSVFVMFASKEDAQKCVSAKPSYGRVQSALGQLFVPQLIVSMKGDPVTRDAISDETEKANVKEQKQQEEGGADNNGPSHRRLITRGLICVARGVPNDVPVRDVQSKLGSIRGVGKGVIDIAYIPPSDTLSVQQQQQNFTTTTSTAVDSANTKICYIYCTSPQAAANLLQSYNRVFSENEKYAESLGQAIPLLEKCTDSEEEFAMELYSDAVAPRTQKKMERNAAAQHNSGGGNNHHHAKSNNNNNRHQNKNSNSSSSQNKGGAVLLQHHDTVRRDRE